MECYNQGHLLLQRDVLSLHYGEVKARHNTLQSISKKFLTKAWLPKAPFMSYEVLFITKSGVTIKITICDSWTTLMTVYITYDYFYSTNDTWNFNLHHFYKNDTFFTYTHVGQNWLEPATQDNTRTQTALERPSHQPSLHDPR